MSAAPPWTSSWPGSVRCSPRSRRRPCRTAWPSGLTRCSRPRWPREMRPGGRRHGERRHTEIRPNGPAVTAHANPPRPGGRAATAASGCWRCACSRPRPPSSCWPRAATASPASTSARAPGRPPLPRQAARRGCRAERRGRGRVGRARQRARRGALQGSGVAAAGDHAAGFVVVASHAEPLPRRRSGSRSGPSCCVPARLAARRPRRLSSYAAACRRGRRPTGCELVESVHFEGSPATLVVARTGAEDTAWIAAPDCSATHRHVLDTTTLPSGISGP